MLALRAVDLVDIWEQGCASGHAERAHLLLGWVYPDLSREELEALPLGSRDDLLLQLREQIFGPRLESVVRCPKCSESLEINLDIHELRAGSESGDNSAAEWTNGDLSVRFRVPTGGDFRDLEGCGDREEARQRLLERCVVEAHRGDETIEPSQLTQEETIALAERVAQADPRGELMLNSGCPKCGHRWETLLDIASFLWHELDMQVKRLLTEVHDLAWAYSWSERDILTMSARRRRIYLEFAGGMSDYFTRIAERAIGIAEAIKPRVPYRFEHGAFVVPTMPPTEHDEERSAEIADVDAPPTRPAEDPPRPRAQDRSMFVPHRVEEPSRDVSRSTQQPIPATKASNVPGEPQPMGVEPAPVTAPRTASVLKPKPQAATSPSQSANALWDTTQDAATKDQATIGRRTEEAHVVRGGTESRPARASTLTETPNRAALQPAPGPAQVKQPPAPTSEVQGASRASFDRIPPVLRPRRKEEHELSRAMVVSSAERRAEPPREPTIKVTIGRVEVRAVMEPPKPPSSPRKPASSAISLDEYLKQHEERRR